MRKRSKLLLLIGLLSSIAGTLLAANPPTIPGAPPTWHPTGVEESDTMPAQFDGPPQHPVMGPMSYLYSGPVVAPYYRPKTAPAASTAALEEPGVPAARSRFRTSVFAVPYSLDTWYQRDVSNATGNENEAALFAFTNANMATTYTVSSYQQGDATHHYTISLASTTDPQSGAFTMTTPYIPTGYTDAFDTTVVANQYADGVRPGALYLTSCVGYSTAPGQAIGNPTAVRIWGSDNGGATWTTSGQTVDYATSTDTEFIDKPVTDISRFTTDRGSIYVAWARFPTNFPYQHSRILVRRNRNGLWQYCRPVGGGCDTAWDATVVVNDGSGNDSSGTPQVVVNPENGNVYVFWINANGQIQMRRWTYGNAWSSDGFYPPPAQAPITVVQGILLPTRNSGYLPNGLRASVVPMIRYSVARHAVVAVWHARSVDPEPTIGTNQTALYYTTFNPDTISGPVAATLLNDASESQIQPALDFDGSGNALVTYYSTQNFPPLNGSQTCWQNSQACASYQLFGLSLSPTGQVTGPTLINGGPSNLGYGTAYIGDYHDTFYFTYPTSLGSVWNTTWTQNLGTYASPAEDIWLTGIK
jgi:hypothetical protein